MKNQKKPRKKISIMSKILIGFALGIVAGIIFREKIVIIEPLGTIFINLLQMLVVPLVFSSLAVGMASLSDLNKMGRIGGRTLLMIVITTVMSTTIGLIIALTVKPGAGVNLIVPGTQKITSIAQPSLLTTLMETVPKNPVAAMAEGAMLQVICFAVFLGIAMVLAGDKAKPLFNVLESLANTMYKLTNIVIGYAPIGVFALIATVVGKQGAEILLPLIKLIFCVYLGVGLTIIFVNGLFTVKIIGRLSIKKFFKEYFPAMTFSFITASSSGTLPISLKCTQQGMGVSKRISSFVQSLGATVNMNGTSLYQGICVVFVSQLMGWDLTIGQLLTVVVTALLAAVGTAGVPGAGLIMLTMVLTSIGLPPEAIALVAGVDRLLDAARCVPNVTGDAAMALVISKYEGELDMDIFEGRKKYNEKEADLREDALTQK